ncbi:MAG: rod-binding protein [Candidatus Anammoxibacter sp.]
MTNLIEPLKTHDAGSLLKIEQMKRNINSLQKEKGIGITRQFKSNKSDDVDARNYRLKEVSRDFEQIFVTQLIKNMWKAIPSDEEAEMPGGDIYMEMVQSALAGELVKGEGMGIGKMLYEQMIGNKAQRDNVIKSINEYKSFKINR